MKANKKSTRLDLSVDVIEYMFTEWLVRQGLFSAYKANYEKSCSHQRSFRVYLRIKIRFLSRSSQIGVASLISSSFFYVMTPEGYDFWADKSNLWRLFCCKFKSIL